jgi:hypothetical protein
MKEIFRVWGLETSGFPETMPGSIFMKKFQTSPMCIWWLPCELECRWIITHWIKEFLHGIEEISSLVCVGQINMALFAWKICLSGLHSVVRSTSLRRGLCNLWLNFLVASWSFTLLLHMLICLLFIESCLVLSLYFYFISVACSVFLILLSPPESHTESILIHDCLQFNLNLQVTTRWQQVYSYQTMWSEFCLELICSLAVSEFPLQ